MIVVTGATGQLGSLIVRQLLERLPAEQVGVSVRDPAKAADLAARGVRVRRGDFGEPATLPHAFEGAEQVLLVSANSLGPDAVAGHTAAADAAYAAGAQRVLYTSHQAARRADSSFPPARDHAQMEAYLASTGRPFTSLRDGFHANTVPMLAAGAVESGELVAPADGPVSWTTREDLAAGAAAVLTDPDGRPEQDLVTLTAGEAIDLEQVAALLAEGSGRPVRRIVVDDEAYVARSVERGVPEPAARLLLTMFEAARDGDFDEVDPTLERLVGRPPQTVRDVLAG